MLLERREHSWATMKLKRHIESMCLVKEKWRYVMISPSMKMLPLGRLEIFLSQRKTKKKKQEELKDEPMPDVEGSMDPIDSPSSNKRRPS